VAERGINDEEIDLEWDNIPFEKAHMLEPDDMEVLWLNDESDAVLMTLKCMACGNTYRRPCDRPGESEDRKGEATVMSRCPKCLETGPAVLVGLERGTAFVDEKGEV